MMRHIVSIPLWCRKWANKNYYERKLGKIFIVGREVYEEAVKNLNINNVYQTKVGDFGCDTFAGKEYFKEGKFSSLELKSVSEFQEHGGIHFRYFVYSNHNCLTEPISEKLESLRVAIFKNFKEDLR